MKRYTLALGVDDAGKSLGRLLRDAYPLAPDHVVRKAFKERDVKLNGRRSDETAIVRASDTVEWFTLWQAPEIPIIYEDDNVLIVNKPAGLSSDPQGGVAASLLQWACDRTGEAHPSVQLVHRLDQQTSGLLVLSRNEVAYEALTNAFRGRTVAKAYECLVGGSPLSHQVMRAYLIKDEENSLVRILDRPAPAAREIITEYKLLQHTDGLSRLEVLLHTGRTHQIRAHLSHAGLPILGDDKYGNRALNKSNKARRLMLAAVHIIFPPEGPLGYLSAKQFRIRAPF